MQHEQLSRILSESEAALTLFQQSCAEANEACAALRDAEVEIDRLEPLAAAPDACTDVRDWFADVHREFVRRRVEARRVATSLAVQQSKLILARAELSYELAAQSCRRSVARRRDALRLLPSRAAAGVPGDWLAGG